MDICHPDGDSTTIDPESGEETFNFYPGPCKGDIKRIIAELEKIPDIGFSNPYAATELALLKVERDTPQDFEAAQEAYYRKCVAPTIARSREQSATWRCGNAYQQCAPFATSEQIEKWGASAENDN